VRGLGATGNESVGNCTVGTGSEKSQKGAYGPQNDPQKGGRELVSEKLERDTKRNKFKERCAKYGQVTCKADASDLNVHRPVEPEKVKRGGGEKSKTALLGSKAEGGEESGARVQEVDRSTKIGHRQRGL